MTDETLLREFLARNPKWTRRQAEHHGYFIFAEAYMIMAEANYRPEAPSDLGGNIQLSDAEMKNPDRLMAEAFHYAARLHKEEDSRSFWIGCSKNPPSAKRAFALCIEAARLLCSGSYPFAIELLKQALVLLEAVKKEREQRAA